MCCGWRGRILRASPAAFPTARLRAIGAARRLLPLVPEQYRELIQQIDLDGRKPEDVASRLGLTRNNVTVRLHRARKHLREALMQNCRACGTHGCLDCTCGEPARRVPRPLRVSRDAASRH